VEMRKAQTKRETESEQAESTAVEMQKTQTMRETESDQPCTSGLFSFLALSMYICVGKRVHVLTFADVTISGS